MKNPIIFYDASCPFCSKVVRFILKHEKSNDLRFSSLQGDFAKSFLSSKGVHEIDMSTFYLYKNGELYQKSTAALRLLSFLKWYLFFLNVLWILPRVFRDFFYNIIAKNRYKLFKDRCDFGHLNTDRDLDQGSITT